MPQTASAKKALRASARRRLVNDRRRQKMRAAIRSAKEALTGSDKAKMAAALKTAQQAIDRAAAHRVIHPNTAARKKARLQKRLPVA